MSRGAKMQTRAALDGTLKKMTRCEKFLGTPMKIAEKCKDKVKHVSGQLDGIRQNPDRLKTRA